MIPTDSTFQIVVGYDFSDQADLALDQALALARKSGPTAIHVIGVLTSRAGSDLSRPRHDIDHTEATDLQQQIAGVVHELGGDLDPETRVFIHTRIGTPDEEILSLAREAQADLIILGTHGRTGLSRIALGSIAESVLRRAACPVLVMRVPHYKEPATAVALDPPCAACLARRSETGDRERWCLEHARPYVPPSRYGPRYGRMLLHDADEWRLA